MLKITYAPRDEKLAGEMKSDLMQSALALDRDYLLVLVSQETFKDSGVVQTVKEALQQKQQVIPVLLERVTLPPELSGLPPLDFSRGYRKDRLLYYLRWADVGRARIAANRRIMAFMLLIVGIMFASALIGIAGGLVAFPQNEYATDDALENATINALVIPTLEAFMPRTTDDALHFPETAVAAPTRLRGFLIQTATAIPADIHSTLAAQATSADMTMTALSIRSMTPVATTPEG